MRDLAREEQVNGDRGGRAAALLRDYFVANGRLITPPGAGIFLMEGSASTEAYYIERGIVQFARFAANGRHAILREMGPGETFGEMSALDGKPRSVSVLTKGDQCSFRQLTAEQYHALLIEHPEVALWLAMEMANRIRDLTDRTVELATMPVSSRLQSQLLRLCERDGIAEDMAVITSLPTHIELAAMIGTHREAVTRELNELSRAGIIAQSSRKLTVRSVTQLSRLLAKTSGASG
jgi:CRP/FNR family transcriptional regulator, cyclic AMP receptor protein